MKKKFVEYDVPTANWNLLESESDFEKLRTCRSIFHRLLNLAIATVLKV